MDIYKLSPSDLTFLWDECPRCFYLKVRRGFDRPRAPMPSIFNKIDRLMKSYFEGQPASEIDPSLAGGVVRFGEKWVESLPLSLPGRQAGCYFRGKFDTVVSFRDGSYAVIDFKTSEARPEHVAFYSRQLHAYAHTLEHPAAGRFSLQPVTRLGLLVVEPRAMEKTADGRIAYLGHVTWQEIPHDQIGFMDYIDGVLAVLEQPVPPPAGQDCPFCAYRQRARQEDA
jgi:hypothetical protein